MCAGQTEVSQHWREFVERRATTASGHTHRPAQDRWAAQTEIRKKQKNNPRNEQRENTESVCVEGQFRRGRWHRRNQKKTTAMAHAGKLRAGRTHFERSNRNRK